MHFFYYYSKIEDHDLNVVQYWLCANQCKKTKDVHVFAVSVSEKGWETKEWFFVLLYLSILHTEKIENHLFKLTSKLETPSLSRMGVLITGGH